ncbi:MAG: phosphomannomutase [Pseudomonadota bacterium]
MATLTDALKSGSAAFGTSGLRGLVDDLTPEVVYAATRASLLHMRQNHDLAEATPVWLGRDLRPSSPAIAATITKTANAMGHPVRDAGAVPTPALALSAAAKHEPVIMVTGSHIPFDRNGIKFYMPGGEASKADEQAILNMPLHAQINGSANVQDVSQQVRETYLQRYTTTFPDLMVGMTVGLYQHSAVGRDLNVELFERLGAEVVPLGRSDEFIPIDTEAVGKADREQAKAWAKDHTLDALFSTDGDGDRPLLADETGTYFRGDALCILAGHALGINTMVTPVSSNTALEKSGWFAATTRTKIGSPHVIAAMQGQPGSVAGFEANGGFLLGSTLNVKGKPLAALPTRDAILPALACLALAKRCGHPLSHLHGLLPPRATASDRLENIPTLQSAHLIETLAQKPNNATHLLLPTRSVVATDKTDGHRMTLDDGTIVHLRPSGNAPELRIYGEAETQAQADELVSATKARLLKML